MAAERGDGGGGGGAAAAGDGAAPAPAPACDKKSMHEEALNKVDQVVFRLQQLQSTIAMARQATLRLDDSPGDDVASGEWKEWSAPAHMVHQAILDIQLLVTRLGSDSILHSSLHLQQQLQHQLQLQQQHQQRVITKQQHSASKVKNRSWKVAGKSENAVLFPNAVFSPPSTPTPAATPCSLKAERPPLLGKRRQEQAACNQVLVGKRRQEQAASSQVSLPLLIDKLPSKRRPAEASTSSTQVATSQGLPYPPCHFSRRGRPSSSPRQPECKSNKPSRRRTKGKENLLHLDAGQSMLQRAKGWMQLHRH